MWKFTLAVQSDKANSMAVITANESMKFQLTIRVKVIEPSAWRWLQPMYKWNFNGQFTIREKRSAIQPNTESPESPEHSGMSQNSQFEAVKHHGRIPFGCLQKLCCSTQSSMVKESKGATGFAISAKRSLHETHESPLSVLLTFPIYLTPKGSRHSKTAIKQNFMQKSDPQGLEALRSVLRFYKTLLLISIFEEN